MSVGSNSFGVTRPARSLFLYGGDSEESTKCRLAVISRADKSWPHLSDLRCSLSSQNAFFRRELALRREKNPSEKQKEAHKIQEYASKKQSSQPTV